MPSRAGDAKAGVPVPVSRSNVSDVAVDRGSLQNAIDATVKRSLDDALRSVGIIVPEQQEEAVAERLTRELTVEVEQHYQGPLPPPTMLRAFDDAVPGLATQIVEMAAKEQRHRHVWERRALWNDIFTESGGLLLGWGLAIFCAGLAGLLAWHGNNVGTGLMLSVVAGSIVKTIVNGRNMPAPDTAGPGVRTDLEPKRSGSPPKKGRNRSRK